MNSRILVLLPLLSSCGAQESFSRSAPEQDVAPREEESEKKSFGGRAGGADAPAAPSAAPPIVGGQVAADGRGFDGLDEGGAKSKGDAVSEDAEATPAATRAWFPESFLWMPMVETNAAGAATIPLTVPDTLTTWRVLAVGQSAEGAQGGTVESFLSTLPAYVDVVAPTFVYAGDRMGLPVQVVNQGEAALASSLSVEVAGGGFAGTVSVPVGGSVVRTVSLAATSPGDLVVRAVLGDIDTVEKHVDVRPSGRPVAQIRGGTLAGPRDLTLDGIPGGRYGDLRVVVFPGARSVIAREAVTAGRRSGGVSGAAYAYALAGRARPLAGVGDITDDSLRTLSLVALQQLTYACRAPDANTAAAAYAGLRGADKDTLAGRLAERLADTVRSGQQPDGLYGLYDGASLDEVLVNTARAVWVLGPDEKATRLRAQGAFERFRDRLDTPAVAVWALAAGVVEGEQADALRAVVTEALVTQPDGTRRLDGMGSVSDAEATALAALVLTDDAVQADLAASLLTRYTAWQGFGPGYANLVSLDAIDAVMGGEVPARVTVRLEVDGQSVGEASLDPAAPYQAITLSGPAVEAPGPHAVRLVADPPVPGLAFTLNATTYLPWTQAEAAGLDLTVTPGALRVGEATTLALNVAGPVGDVVDLDIGLPAGFNVDRASLPAQGTWQVEDGALHATGVRLEEGRWSAVLTATPELAGQIQTGPSVVAARGEQFVRVPTTWTVR